MIVLAAIVGVCAFAGAAAGERPALVFAANVEPSTAADAPATLGRRQAGRRIAPRNAPLTSSATGSSGVENGQESTSAGPVGEVDPLVSNGLGSPLCKGALGGEELSRAGQRDCATSGFVAAPAPTGNYGIDVHIDTGALGIGSGTVPSLVQDMFVAPVWMALVWAVHALMVMLEWCFTIDVLDSPAAGGVGRGLRGAQASFTEPWLASVLAIASMLTLYDGLIRRRVAETLGQALTTLAMIVGGMWVIADPTGTVGALGGWANRASLGTLAIAARGTPSGPGRVLADSMDSVFAAVIEAPWCYLEFGDVAWCRDPARLDPRLHAAGLKIAAGELALIGCKPGLGALPDCVARDSAQATALEHSAQLLREAQSNGAVFLALPANGPSRNSINEQGSLLRAICESSEATSCRGPTAAQAEFRTSGQTWSRAGGLLLIVAGVLGMMLLLGFIALRLLASAAFGLFYLLLAPGAVLAPALGDGGRAVFRRWTGQLLGAVVSKLLFSFLLGVVLAVLATLSSLEALGWWTQWLLMSSFVWGAYLRRHQALAIASGSHAGGRSAGVSVDSARSITRLVREALEPPRKAIGAARALRSKVSRPAPETEQRAQQAQVARSGQSTGWEEQARRMLLRERLHAGNRVQAEPQIRERLSAKREQLARVRRERSKALSSGERRRASRLRVRGARVKEEIEREQEGLSAARRLAGEGVSTRSRTGHVFTSERLQRQARFLRAQAKLPPSAHARGAGHRRDYGALSGLVGYAREEYERLDPQRRRTARLEIDRELALHKDTREREHGMTASRAERSTLDAWREPGHANRGSTAPADSSSDSSSVMRDAREVAAGRKRQLGLDRD